jgi:glycosyltransferase involved in cell wall biosynthesis
MYCGRPVIATDVAGHAEVIEHGAKGFLAKVLTVEALLETLEQAWQKRLELKHMDLSPAWFKRPGRPVWQDLSQERSGFCIANVICR